MLFQTIKTFTENFPRKLKSIVSEATNDRVFVFLHSRPSFSNVVPWPSIFGYPGFFPFTKILHFYVCSGAHIQYSSNVSVELANVNF